MLMRLRGRRGRGMLMFLSGCRPGGQQHANQNQSGHGPRNLVMAAVGRRLQPAQTVERRLQPPRTAKVYTRRGLWAGRGSKTVRRSYSRRIEVVMIGAAITRVAAGVAITTTVFSHVSMTADGRTADS